MTDIPRPDAPTVYQRMLTSNPIRFPGDRSSCATVLRAASSRMSNARSRRLGRASRQPSPTPMRCAAPTSRSVVSRRVPLEPELEGETRRDPLDEAPSEPKLAVALREPEPELGHRRVALVEDGESVPPVASGPCRTTQRVH